MVPISSLMLHSTAQVHLMAPKQNCRNPSTMAKENLNIGCRDGTGDTLRDGAIKLNNVINEVYNALGDGTNAQIDIATPAAGQVLRWNGSTAFVSSNYIGSNLDVAGNRACRIMAMLSLNHMALAIFTFADLLEVL